jgi:hypothetical protein
MRLRVASSLSNSWTKEPIEAVDSGPALLPMPDRHYANRSLSAAEPVSAPPKRKLENGEQRPAPETRAQRTEMPEIAGQRPARRVRDKIAASKRKGLWVGGPVPLGYRCIDKKLEIVPEEADVVCTIFTRYRELGSMGALLSAQRQARLRSADRRSLDRNARRPRNLGKFRSGFAARLFRARAHTVPAASCFAGGRCRDRQRSGRTLRADRQQGQRGRAAQSRTGATHRRVARH